MVFPTVKLHHLYSLNLYEDLDIIFEDLSMINMDNIKWKQKNTLRGISKIT